MRRHSRLLPADPTGWVSPCSARPKDRRHTREQAPRQPVQPPAATGLHRLGHSERPESRGVCCAGIPSTGCPHAHSSRRIFDGQLRNARQPLEVIPPEFRLVHWDPHQAGNSHKRKYWPLRGSPLSQTPRMTLPSQVRETRKRDHDTGSRRQLERTTPYGRGETSAESAAEPASHRSPGTPSYPHDAESRERGPTPKVTGR